MRPLFNSRLYRCEPVVDWLGLQGRGFSVVITRLRPFSVIARPFALVSLRAPEGRVAIPTEGVIARPPQGGRGDCFASLAMTEGNNHRARNNT